MVVKHGGNLFAVAAREGVAWRQVLDFSASINPLGPSPAVREAVLAAMDRMVHYPERTGAALRRQLSEAWGVAADRIVVGNGATDLLFDWCRWVGNGAIAAPAFGEFHRAWPNASLFPLTERAQWPADGPVVFTRPANPTGTLIDAGEVLRYAQERRDAVLVDESFLDFCDGESLLTAAEGNLFVLRSLTKFWALPGLRVGALVGDVEEIAGMRPPWTLNVLAEAAALAALGDAEHARRTREFVRAEGEWLACALRSLPGLSVWPVRANYLFVETERAAEIAAFAEQRRVLVRDCSGWPGFACRAIRVAVRQRWENEVLLSVLRECLCG